jgi:hypothetical protein
MRRRQLPRAQRRVLNQVARANNAGAIWLKAPYLHDYKIVRKLTRRGYIAREVRQYGRGWVILDLLTPKGWAASSISPDKSGIMEEPNSPAFDNTPALLHQGATQ